MHPFAERMMLAKAVKRAMSAGDERAIAEAAETPAPAAAPAPRTLTLTRKPAPATPTKGLLTTLTPDVT